MLPSSNKKVSSINNASGRKNEFSPIGSHRVYKPCLRIDPVPSSVWPPENELIGIFVGFFCLIFHCLEFCVVVVCMCVACVCVWRVCFVCTCVCVVWFIHTCVYKTEDNCECPSLGTICVFIEGPGLSRDWNSYRLH